MKLWDALDKIEGTERKSWRVHFEHVRGCALESDYFPSYDEIGFPGEEVAWLIACKFAAATKGRCANIDVREDGGKGSVSRKLNPSASYQDASEAEANDAGQQVVSEPYSVTWEREWRKQWNRFFSGKPIEQGWDAAPLPSGFKTFHPIAYREVLPVGAHVNIDDGIDARVNGVLIDQDGVQYKCAWWNGRARVCEWLMEFEVQAKSVGKMRVGFAPMSSDGADCA